MNGDCEFKNGVNETKWSSPSKIRSCQKDGGVDSSTELKEYLDGNRNLAYEEVVQMLDDTIKSLLKRQEFVSAEVKRELRFIQRQTRYSSDLSLQRHVVNHIIQSGIGHVFLRVWQSLSTIDYMHPENYISFQNLQAIISIIWNCTDKSSQLCEALVRGSVIHSLLSELSDTKLSMSNLNDEISLYLVKAYLGILHNIVRSCSDSRKLFRLANAVPTLQQYLNRPQGLVRTKAYLILSYVINEDENGIINATDENIAYMIGILQDALASENHFVPSFAFWAAEIACGLNHLAVNDLNKARIGRLGALPLYIDMLKSGNEEEQNLAAAGLWILSFHPDNKQLMKQDPNCIEGVYLPINLSQLKSDLFNFYDKYVAPTLQFVTSNSTLDSICRAARGALWVIKSAPDPSIPAVSVSDANVPHVMLSYHWASQKTMIVVKERLKAEGFKVWMDIDNMSGSTLEAMALAVEQAAVVLVCMSQGYKDSPSCRTEAEYTYRLHKDIVPLLLQTGYIPDGWLGILVGTKLYFDLSTPEAFNREINRAIREIGNRGLLNTRFTQHSAVTSSSSNGLLSITADSKSMPSSSMHSYLGGIVNNVSNWTRSDVESWLTSLQLSHLFDRLHDFDGQLLIQYRKMLQTCPQYFYHTLKDMLKMNLCEILHFTKALEDLNC